MPFHPRRVIRPTLSLALVVAAGACSAVRPGPESPRVEISGAWVGTVEVDGQALDARLDLVQRGDALEAVLRADDLGLTSEGEGDLDADGTFVLEMGYDLECPGTARLQGRWQDASGRLVGTLAAADCTGSFTGSFVFRRR